jgi:hypothetical protein
MSLRSRSGLKAIPSVPRIYTVGRADRMDEQDGGYGHLEASELICCTHLAQKPEAWDASVSNIKQSGLGNS